MRKSWNVQSLKDVTGVRERFQTLHKDLCIKKDKMCCITLSYISHLELLHQSSADNSIIHVELNEKHHIRLSLCLYFADCFAGRSFCSQT